MPRRKRRSFTTEQKADAVRMVREVGNLAKVARDLDLTETALRNWVKQADIDEGNGPEGALTTEEREELRRLRRENRTLRQERDFAKKAAVGSCHRRNASFQSGAGGNSNGKDWTTWTLGLSKGRRVESLERGAIAE